MNTGQKNSKGRTIFRGPRGGEYVLGPGGKKIRTFTRATAAAPAPAPAPAPASPGIPGFTKTRFTAHTFVRNPRVYIKNSSGRYWAVSSTGEKWAIKKANMVTNIHTGAIKSIANHLKNGPATGVVAAPVAAPAGSSPIPTAMKKLLRVGNKFVSRNGYVYNRNGSLFYSRYINSHARNTVLKNAYAKDPKYLRKYEIPFMSNGSAPARLKLMNNGTEIRGKYNDRMRAKVYFDKHGNLYFVTLNGRKIPVTDPTHSHSRSGSFRQSLKNVRQLKRIIGSINTRFPRFAIPPNSPPPVRPTRSSPALLENMMNQIYLGGRGSNVNATRYTPEERTRLAVRLSESIEAFKQMRNRKRYNARFSRAMANAPNTSAANRASHLNAAARALERVGYYDDAIRAYTRGLRAVKPLTGNVPASVRRMAATPNRWTPAPAGENYNILLNEMTRPHLVIKVPGITAPLYLTPNSFRGLVKNAARVNIAPNNLRDWLRMARRNFPNEPLFRHPINKSKNVLPTHVRFSRS
jgi:tetratricopeptide (TPR) repeat protein